MIREPMRRLMLTALLLAGAVAPASAQQDFDAERPRWRVVPRLGSFISTESVVMEGSRPGSTRWASVDHGAVIGVAADFDSPLWWLGFRLSADRTIAADARFRRGPVCTALPCAAREIVNANATLTAFSMDIRLQPAPRRWPVRPFLLAGFDRLRLTFDGDLQRGERPDEEVRPAIHLGYGLDFDIFSAPLRIEGVHRAFYQEGDVSSPQLHYLIMGGVRIPID